MNRNVIIIIPLTLTALIVLILFSFGPMSGIKKNAETNPISLKPQGIKLVSINGQTTQFNRYSNREVKENYYVINLPQDWKVKSGQRAGEYTFTFADGRGAIELMDVPDNTTLELYVLSQKEPLLKKSLVNYARKHYRRLMINNNEAYELLYSNSDNRRSITTIQTYIVGADHASVITFNVKPNKYARLIPVINAVVNSFNWDVNK